MKASTRRFSFSQLSPESRRLLNRMAVVTIACLLAALAAAAQDVPRFEVGGNFVALRSGGTGTFGPGFTGVYNLGRFVSLEGSLNWLPDGLGLASIGNNSNTLEGLFGAKAGYRSEKFGIFGKFKPGFITSSNSLRSENFIIIPAAGGGSAIVPDARFARLTERAIEFGQVLEYYPSRNWAFRYDIGDLVIFNEPLTSPAGVPGIIVSPLFRNGNTSNSFQFSTGVHYRF